MYLIYLDEFGHESNSNEDRQSPVFGYGGIIIPAKNAAAFSTHFFDMKLIAFNNIFSAKTRATQKRVENGEQFSTKERRIHEKNLRIVRRLSKMSNSERLQDSELRHLAAIFEVKGSEVFAPSYVRKLIERKRKKIPGSARRLRNVINFIKMFINSLEKFDAEIFYYGFHNSRFPQLKDNERIHTKIVSDVLKQAGQIGSDRNTTVKIIFDRHHTDETKGVEKDGKVHRVTGRFEFARDVIINKRLYENITDPIYSSKSHWSQGVQAADWCCTLLGVLWSYRTSKKKYRKYKQFYDAIGEPVLKMACGNAIFRTSLNNFEGRVYARQEEFVFEKDNVQDSGFKRPYMN